MNAPILLAGASSGMGLATARRLVDSGRQIVAAGRSSGDLPSLGIPVVPFEAGVRGPGPEELPAELGGLVYFPGTISLKPFHRLGREDFLRDLEVNLLGAVELIQTALPALRAGKPSSVVLFSTVAVQQGMSFHASIAAAKGAVEGLAKSLATELAPDIRVNCIAPSLTDTPLAASLLSSDAKREAAAGRHPLKRISEADEMAALVEFLLSDTSQAFSGQILHPDNGLSSLRPL